MHRAPPYVTADIHFIDFAESATGPLSQQKGGQQRWATDGERESEALRAVIVGFMDAPDARAP